MYAGGNESYIVRRLRNIIHLEQVTRVHNRGRVKRPIASTLEGQKPYFSIKSPG